MMKWEGCEGSGLGLFQATIPALAWRDLQQASGLATGASKNHLPIQH